MSKKPFDPLGKSITKLTEMAQGARTRALRLRKEGAEEDAIKAAEVDAGWKLHALD